MKHIHWLVWLFLFLHLCNNVHAQIWNLTVNGVSSNFTWVQGDSIWWEYNLPAGGTANGEIWIDINSNGIIDQSTDKMLYIFTQTDGQYGGNGPGDMDSTVNGHIFMGTSNVGFAPVQHIFKFTHNTSQSIRGIVIPMVSPVYTISGAATSPPLVSPQNILITGGGNWMALTDASGNYIINFNSSVSGRQMRISVWDKFPPYIVRDTTLSMNKSYTGINFVFTKPVAQIVGYLKGEDDHVLPNVQIRCYPCTGSGSSKYSTTDVNGFFQFGFTSSEIAVAPMWALQASSSGVAPSYFPPRSRCIAINSNDSLYLDLIAYIADDSITGRVTIVGRIPTNQSFRVYAYASDSGQTESQSDPNTGNFTLHITKKMYNYNLGFNNLPQAYGFQGGVVAHPGDKDLIMNLDTIYWRPQTSNTSNSLRAISFINETIGWIGGYNGMVLKTINSGTSWSSQTTNTSNNINDIFFTNDQTGWFVANGGMIKKTINGGTNWNSQISPTANNLYAIQFIDGSTGWAVGGSSSQGTFLKTIDGGSNWNSLNPQVYYPITSLSFISANIGWIGTNSGILKTTDGGTTWDLQYYTSVNSIKFLNESIGWFSSHSGMVYYTSDGGTNWAPQSTGHGFNIRCMDCIDIYNCWVAGDYGNIFKTTDGGSTWVRQLTNNNNNFYAIQIMDQTYGWVVGDNGTILRADIVSSVWENNTFGVPSKFSLSQNYPNPFNPSTIISFDLKVKSFVTLKVFDILGREVATVVSEELLAGNYSRQWNAIGQPSGVYFYRLQAGTYSETKKLVLIR